MMASLLIKNAKIVTAHENYDADIFVEGEKICRIGHHLSVNADRAIDADGRYVFPGGIDAHTHMEMPFMGTKSSDDFFTGTRAGIFGGTTTIIDFAIQQQGDTLMAAFNQWREKARKAVGDYAFHVAVTDFNDRTRQEIKELITMHGITSFKTFMAYKGALMIDDRQMFDLMGETAKYGGMVMAHAENGDIIDALVKAALERGEHAPKYHALTRPPIAEAEATGRFIDLAYAGAHPCYVVHVTCKDALDRVRRAQERDQKVFVETCVQYLLLDDSLYDRGFLGAQFVMSPPLRTKADQNALWSGIKQNLVHTVATDHCPFCMEQKKMGEHAFNKIPNGAPGIEHRVPLMFSEGVVKERISLNKFVEVTSTAPARIFGLYPRKGTIAVGSDADLVIFDPAAKDVLSATTHHMNCDYSAYEGFEIKGRVDMTILRGEVVMENDAVNIEKGFGTYLARNPFSFKNL
jgi:dihydropyrimidinase